MSEHTSRTVLRVLLFVLGYAMLMVACLALMWLLHAHAVQCGYGRQGC